MSSASPTQGPGITPFQALIVAVCVGANMLDGYDIFIMGYALPSLPPEFATKVEKGYLLSSALIGMGISAIFLARLADMFGRRPALIGALVLNVVSLVASALAPNYTVLIVSRFFTGIAIGLIGVTCVVIGQEMMPSRLRSAAVGIVMGGYPVGSFIAGLVGASIVGATGWQGLFWVAAGLNLLILLGMVVFVSETAPFLERSSNPKARAAAEKLRARITLDPPAEPGIAKAKESTSSTKVKLLGPEYRTITTILWVGYAFLTAAFYFIASWTPQLITDASGGDTSVGALAGIMISVGTIVGSLVYAWIGLRIRSTTIAWMSMAIAMLALVGFALTLHGNFALTMALLLGLAFYVTVSAYTTIANSAYPVLVRSKGYGMVLGVGRIGAILSPILGGYAATFATPQTMYTAVLVPLALVGLCAMLLSKPTRAQDDPKLARDAAAH
jgi:MFS family permease